MPDALATTKRYFLPAIMSAGAAFLFWSVSAAAMERQIRLEHQESVSLTVYNTDLALVRDRRRVALMPGVNDLAFIDVSARIRPETVVFAPQGEGAAIELLEQNFDFDLLTPRKLLEKSIGRTIRIVRINPATGEETVEEAQVLSTNEGALFRIGDRIEAIGAGDAHDLPGRLVFDRLPENLRPRPTLIVTVDTVEDAERPVVLSYLTGGLSWQADYVANLSKDERQLALQGWVTLTNTSGTGYRDAQLQLVAGDVNVVQPRLQRGVKFETMAAAAPDQPMAEEGLLDYHLYTLQRPTTILDNQTKQVALLSAPAVPVRKDYVARGPEYVYRSRIGPFDRQQVGIWLTLENTKEGGLGMPLPKGVVRAYAQDSEGGSQFIGEDAIDHTPEGDTVRLNVGKAFDVTIDRRQTAYRDNRSSRETAWEFETEHEIVVRNAKDEPVEVKIEEPMPGDWTVIEESSPHVKEDSQTAVWRIAVAPKGETKLVYSVRVVIPR